MSQITICFLVVYLIEASIIWQYCNTLFIAKYSQKLSGGLLLILYLLLFLISTLFPERPLVNALFFLAFNYLFIVLMFQLRWYTAFFHTVSITIIMMLSELIVIAIITGLPLKNYYQKSVYFRNVLLVSVFSKTLYFLYLNIFIHFVSSKKRPANPNEKSAFLLCIPSTISVYIILLLVTVCWNLEENIFLDWLIAIGAILMLLSNVLIFKTYSYSLKKQNDFAQMQLSLQRESASSAYYKMLLKQTENHSVLIHDINKHLQSIALLNYRGENKKIEEYINRIVSSSELRSAHRMCDNELLNVILNRYAQQCKNKNITFRIDIRNHTVNFLAEDDLTSLFCNLLDNAIEAASCCSHAFIELNVSQHPNTDFITLTMTNSCLKTPFSKGSILKSTKSNTFCHGFGLKSIARIVEKYNGNSEYYYTDDTHIFHSIIILQNKY